VAVDSLAQAWPTGSAGGRAESSHEEFLAACLLCEVAGREFQDGRAVSALPGFRPACVLGAVPRAVPLAWEVCVCGHARAA
jgi:hypothetical protein